MTGPSTDNKRGTPRAARIVVTGGASRDARRPLDIEVELAGFLTAARDLSESRFDEAWIHQQFQDVELRLGEQAGTLRRKFLDGGVLYKKKAGNAPGPESFKLAVGFVDNFVEELRSTGKKIEGDGRKLKLEMGDKLALHLIDRVRGEMLNSIGLFLTPQLKNGTSVVQKALEAFPKLLEFLQEIRDWQTRVHENSDWRSEDKIVRSSSEKITANLKTLQACFGQNTRDCLALLVNIIDVSENGLETRPKRAWNKQDGYMPPVLSASPPRRGFED